MMPAHDNCIDRITRASRVVLLFALLASCNRMATPPEKQILKDADAKAAAGDYLQAISLYERSLDGTAASAETHYQIALLYDDKMNDPLNALHHFKRYLTLTPTGPHANQVKDFMKRDELALVTNLSGDSVISHAEAARLKNENLALRQQLAERSTQAKTAATNQKSPAKKAHAAKTNSKHAKPSHHSRVVENQ